MAHLNHQESTPTFMNTRDQNDTLTLCYTHLSASTFERMDLQWRSNKGRVWRKAGKENIVHLC